VSDYPLYYDREGKPISLREWADAMGTGRDRHVALDYVGEVKVSTVWMGIDYNWSRTGPPLIFETMIFGGNHDEECWRYPTEAAALAGHDQALSLVRESERLTADMREHLDRTLGKDS
jgi:hypothetical protein